MNVTTEQHQDDVISGCRMDYVPEKRHIEHVPFQMLQSLLSQASEQEEVAMPHHERTHRGGTPVKAGALAEEPSGQQQPQPEERSIVTNPKVSKKIAFLEREAVQLLQDLESPPTSKSVHHQGPCLPASAIRFSKYLVFLWQRKIGCVVSYEWRYGLVFYQSAPGVWSDPVFLKHTYVSIGATCGWSRGGSLFAISDDAEMIQFLKMTSSNRVPVNTWCLESRFSNDSINQSITCKSLGAHVTRYHVDSAASYIVDLSFKIGRESVDRDMHAHVYGSPTIHVRDILDSHGSKCIMQDVYAYFDAYKSSSMARKTKKLFEEERKSIYSSMNPVQRRSSSCLSTSTAGSGGGGRFSSCERMSSPYSSEPSSLSYGTTRAPQRQSSLFGDTQLLDLDLGDP